MAADKKTFIRNAQKQVQKGQLDRAIASYKAILKIDKNDEKIHNALGDLYIRKNMKSEGIKEYLWVADYYEKDGFHLRSIAICQKILNLESNLAEVRLKLADLYSQQRLPAEAKAQYLQVADFFDKKGKVAQALEVFGKIADLDPDNLKVRVRLGAMYEKQSLPAKAAGEYTRAAEGHLKKKETDKAAALLEQAMKLSPTSLPARLVTAELHAGREEWDKIVETLEPLMAAGGADAQVLKTYAGACLKTGRPADAIKALEMAREMEPSSLPVKTLLGRAYMQGEEFDKAFDVYSPMISDDLKDNRIEAAEDLARALAEGAPQSDKAQQRLLEVLQQKGDTEEIPGVYLKLAEIYQGRELTKNAAGALEKYLELKPDDKEAAARLQTLGSGSAPAPAAALAEPVREEPPVPSEPSPLEEMEVEMIDIGSDELTEMVSVEEGTVPAAADVVLDDDDILIETDDDEEGILLEVEDEPASLETAAAEAVPEKAAAPEAEAIQEEGTVPGIEEVGESLDDAAFLGMDMEQVAEEEFIEPTAGQAIEELIEESVEELVEEPTGEFVEEVVEEVDLEAGGFASPVEEIPPESVPEPEAALEEEVEAASASLPSEDGLDLDFSALEEAEEPSAPAVELAEAAAGPDHTEEFEEFLAEADFYFQQGLLDEAEFLYRKLSKLAPDNGEIAERLARFEEAPESVEETPVEEAPPLPADEGILAMESDLDRALGEEVKIPASGMKITVGDGKGEEKPGEFSEFLSDLREELDESVPAPDPATADEEGLSEIFQEFREGLKEQLGEEDFETHYNLGIAYKEMGLMQEAIGEFELSEKSEIRRLDSISMIALCYRGMGREEDAVNKLQEGLRQAPEGGNEQKGFIYDLADLYSHIGHEGESVELFSRLYALDSGYRDVSRRAGQTQGAPASPSAPQGDDRPEPAKNKKPRVSYL